MNFLPKKAHLNIGKLVMKALAKENTSIVKEKAFAQIVRQRDHL